VFEQNKIVDYVKNTYPNLSREEKANLAR